ncbi:MAG: carotenoid oxygenase family protein [Spongiibacteraceae bacterium]|jgi:carotenoid cleavage dioxygenase|nr:carotenoid oxygenase family protein [Spongiibacteraceae bacterium]
MAHFPDTPGFTGVLRPLRIECDIHDLEVEGEVPAELDGTFHRVHPDAQFPPKFENDQFFNGDGMISLFHFRKGKVDFRQRYAQTDKWKIEREAGESLFGAYRNPLTDDPRVEGMIRGTANTNVMVHGGKLYATKEDSPPLLMDPLTLETFGYTDFNGKMKSQTFGAHHKIDPKSGNLCNISYASTGLLTRDCTYLEVNPQGELVLETFFEVPYYAMLHDFGLTEDYVVVHVVPIVSSWDRLRAGLPHFGFDTKLPVWLGVMPRRGEGRDMRWFKAPKTVFASHVMNAFNDGSKVYFDIPQAEGNSFPFFPDVDGKPFDPIASRPYLHRWCVDMNSKKDEFESVEQLSPMIDEFPRIDERYVSQPYRHGWMLVMDPDMPMETAGSRASGFRMNKLGHIDHATGEQKSWWAGPSSMIQEPCFVPRSATSPEGDGYLIALVDDLNTNYSDLVILEALRIEEGPIARLKLPFRMRSGLHGNWADRSKLRG